MRILCSRLLDSASNFVFGPWNPGKHLSVDIPPPTDIPVNRQMAILALSAHRLAFHYRSPGIYMTFIFHYRSPGIYMTFILHFAYLKQKKSQRGARVGKKDPQLAKGRGDRRTTVKRLGLLEALAVRGCRGRAMAG
jgi:hypothetical protein